MLRDARLVHARRHAAAVYARARKARFNAQTGKVFVEYQRCIGCGVCVTKCPKDVREMVDGDRVLFCKPLKKSLVRERNVRRQPKKN